MIVQEDSAWVRKMDQTSGGTDILLFPRPGPVHLYRGPSDWTVFGHHPAGPAPAVSVSLPLSL